MSNFFYTIDGRRIKMNLENFTTVGSETVGEMSASKTVGEMSAPTPVVPMSAAEKAKQKREEMAKQKKMAQEMRKNSSKNKPQPKGGNKNQPRAKSEGNNYADFDDSERKESLRLQGDLSLDGIIRAKRFIMEDGSEMKTIVNEKEVLALPQSISFDAQGNMLVGNSQKNINLNIEGQLCIGKTCIDEVSLQKLKGFLK
jgi:hypothetical protein